MKNLSLVSILATLLLSCGIGKKPNLDIDFKENSAIICQGVHSSDPLQLTSEQLWERFDYLMNSSLQLRGLHPVLPTIQNRDTCVNISGLDLSRDNIHNLFLSDADLDVNKLRYLKLAFFWTYAAEDIEADLSRNDLGYYEAFILDTWGYATYQELVDDLSTISIEESLQANFLLAMDFTNVLAEDTDFSLQSFWTNQSNDLSIELQRMAKNLSSEQFNDLYRLPAIFPAINGAGLDFNGKSLNRVDLSLVSNISAAQIHQAISHIGLIFPVMNGSGLDFTVINITQTDLTRVYNLTSEQLNNAPFSGAFPSGFFRVKFPAMDVSTLDLAGRSIREADLSRVTGLTQAQVDSASHTLNVILPDYL